MKPVQYIKLLKAALEKKPSVFIQKGYEYLWEMDLKDSQYEWFENYLASLEDLLADGDFAKSFAEKFVADTELFFKISKSKDARHEIQKSREKLYPEVTLTLFSYVEEVLRKPIPKGEWFKELTLPVILSGGTFVSYDAKWQELKCPIFYWQGYPILDKQKVLVASSKNFHKIEGAEANFWEELEALLDEFKESSPLVDDEDFPIFVRRGTKVYIWLANKKFLSGWNKYHDAFAVWESWDIPFSGK